MHLCHRLCIDTWCHEKRIWEMAEFIAQTLKHYLLLKLVHCLGNPSACLGEGSAWFSSITASQVSKEEKIDSCSIAFLQQKAYADNMDTETTVLQAAALSRGNS